MKYLRVVLILALLAASTSCPVFGDKQIRFWSDRDGGNWAGYSLFAMNADGSAPVNLSKELGVELGSSWSPDGTKILFDSDRTGDSEIFVVNADGSNPVNLTNDPAKSDLSPSWSPDGTKILWERWPLPDMADMDRPEIFVMNADGSNQRNLGDGYRPTWSPDGIKIAFAAPAVFFRDIFVMNLDGSGKLNISNDRARDNSFPSWSPDGLKVAFHGVSDFNGHSSVYVVNVDGSRLLNLSEGFTHAGGASWSPDGTKIAFVSGDIYCVNVDGTNLVNLTQQNPPGWNGHVRWSGDGATILFNTFRDGNWEIYIMNADGSSPVNLTNHPAADQFPSWFSFDFSVLSTLVSPRDKLFTTWGEIKHGNQ